MRKQEFNQLLVGVRNYVWDCIYSNEIADC